MITPGYVQALTAYNAEMNRRLYAAAARLTDEERLRDRGAFWRSIHGTFNHLVWADRMWMARFDGWDKPAVVLAESGSLFAGFAEMRDARVDADLDLRDWAGRVRQDWLDGTTAWFSGATGQEQVRPTALLVAHMFNHQTHHRGQAHAMLTAAGERTGDTDLWLTEL
jgi:uncharacterized damage-inducible protein DinB